MAGGLDHGGGARCEACKLPAPRCICPLLPRARPETRVVIIRQALERKSFGGTGALVGRVLLGSAIVPFGDRTTTCDLSALADPAVDFHVLFPLFGATVVSPALRERPPGRTLGLIVVDASWSQARKMAQRIPALRGLPRVRLPEATSSRFAVRKAPERGRFGTAEAVAIALGILGEKEAAAALETALARVAEHVLRTRGKLPSRKRRLQGRSQESARAAPLAPWGLDARNEGEGALAEPGPEPEPE